MKRLKIAQIAPLWFQVPPKKYGGTERIVSYLTEELVRRGHKVTLFASGDSRTKAKLSSVTNKSLSKLNIPWSDWWWNSHNYSNAFSVADNFDIIHSHWTPMGMYFQKFVKTPTLNTFHNLPIKEDARWNILKKYKNSNAVFISKSQKKEAPTKFKKSWVAYNAIPIEKYIFNKNPENHFIWSGRISPAKGTDFAVKIAKKAGIKLLVAGPIQPEYKDYFNREIKPNLNSKIKYVGELGQSELSSFYSKASGFLYPIRWNEPFGLAIIEAQACGTPVIAFDKGSMAEVIQNKKTGFVVKNVAQALKAVKSFDKIKRSDCRQWVQDHFTVKKMADNYEKIYYQLINK